MDKALFRAYVKELVKEQVEETIENTVRKMLPELLGEAVAELKNTSTGMSGSSYITESASVKKTIPNRQRIAEMMGLERIGDTLSANTSTMQTQLPPHVNPNDPGVKLAIDAINKDYSMLMKKIATTR